MKDKIIHIVEVESSKEEIPHFGGMWKVAYADFITAMMCFFLLLWILNVTPKENLKGLAEYFAETKSHSKTTKDDDLVSGVPNIGSIASMHEKRNFLALMNSLQQNTTIKEFSENVMVDITPEGLRIQVMDSDNRPMFRPGTDTLQPYMEKILTTVGSMISKLPNYVAITGHTASLHTPGSVDLWKLSILRANMTKNFMEQVALNDEHVVKISGIADKEPIDMRNPYSVKNIRISIVLLNQNSVSKYQRSLPR